MRTKKLKNFAGRISIFALDLLLVILSFAIAFLIRKYLTDIFDLRPLFIDDLTDFLFKNWWLVLIYMIVFIFQGLYTYNRPFWEETRVTVKGVFVAVVINYAIVALAKLNPSISRLILAMQPVILLGLMPILKYFHKKLLFKLDLWRIPLLEIRLGTDKSLKEPFAANSYLGYDIVESKKFDIKDKSDINKIYNFIKQEVESKDLGGVLFSVKYLGDEKISLLIEKTFFIVSKILVVPDFIGFDVLSANISHLMYENLFVFDTNKGLNKPINKIIKRVIDIIAGIVMLVFFWPLLLLAMLITFLGDRFPLLYPHKRFGQNGKIFKFYKVRSMYKDGDTVRLPKFFKEHPEYKKMWEKYQKIPEDKDPRIFPGGAFLRKARLDELAQVINLLKGDMSLVGPRPYMPRERELMGDYFDRILAVKPGLTGLWQVSGGNERTFQERMQIDVWYIQNWSLWLDIVIIFKTFLLFLKHGKKNKTHSK